MTLDGPDVIEIWIPDHGAESSQYAAVYGFTSHAT